MSFNQSDQPLRAQSGSTPFAILGGRFHFLLVIEQYINFSFWNRLPNKSQDLSKYLLFSLFYAQDACFFFPDSVTAHHFQRIND